MEVKRCEKESFSVIGKQGSTRDGDGFIGRLWETANSNYSEISALVKKDENGNPVGFWGAMSDMSGSFKPWENNFSEGLYLAGAEVVDNSVPPDNWVKWVIPTYEYVYVKVENGASDIFAQMIKYLEDNQLELVGAVNEYICPAEDGQVYMFFPIRRL